MVTSTACLLLRTFLNVPLCLLVSVNSSLMIGLTCNLKSSTTLTTVKSPENKKKYRYPVTSVRKIYMTKPMIVVRVKLVYKKL